jgi:hypothetical protein
MAACPRSILPDTRREVKQNKLDKHTHTHCTTIFHRPLLRCYRHQLSDTFALLGQNALSLPLFGTILHRAKEVTFHISANTFSRYRGQQGTYPPRLLLDHGKHIKGPCFSLCCITMAFKLYHATLYQTRLCNDIRLVTFPGAQYKQSKTTRLNLGAVDRVLCQQGILSVAFTGVFVCAGRRLVDDAVTSCGPFPRWAFGTHFSFDSPQSIVGSVKCKNGQMTGGLDDFSPEQLGNVGLAFARQAQLAKVASERLHARNKIGTIYLDVGEALLQRLFRDMAENDPSRAL